MAYLVKTPAWLKRLHPGRLLWDMPVDAGAPAVYLTFDDGPHPEITHFVLETLDRYEAAASFFCIGKNVVAAPGLYERMQKSRHTLGNHTMNHRNGWHTPTADYLEDVTAAAQHIQTRYFRPPYGRIRHTQTQALQQAPFHYEIVMWDVLSADFDTELSPAACLEHVVFHTVPGSIVVFHDSEKAFPRLQYALPRFLEHCHRNRWTLKALP